MSCKSTTEARRAACLVDSVKLMKGDNMKRMIALTLAAAYVFMAGCNTIQGAGKDIERGGEKIQSEAKEAKKY